MRAPGGRPRRCTGSRRSHAGGVLRHGRDQHVSASGTSAPGSRSGGSDGWYQYEESDTTPYRRPPRPPRPRGSSGSGTTRTARTGRRWPRRLFKTMIVLIVLLAVVFGGLWVFTPSV